MTAPAVPTAPAAPTAAPAPRTVRRRPWGSTVIALVILAVLLFPVYWMVNVSLQEHATSFSTDWFPFHPSFAAYGQALRDQGGHLLISLAVALGSTLISSLVAAPASFALAKFRLPGRGVLLLAAVVTQMIPGIVIANALYRAYNGLGLLNSLPGLILADASLGIPFAMLLMRSFMAEVPDAVIEAARVDGAGRVRTFVSVVLPMSRNGLITGALFSFLFAWSDFLFALTLSSTDAVTPITMGIYRYLGAQTENWSPVMASSVLACLPSVVLLVLAQRYIAAGISGGAVK
ncbi:MULTISPECIES: carbohydrate ABC transporter permease [unclassified Streptomyces]|uniref:Carbohydrate ABC transporter permease n=1 Tax=Streptomyces evansiae TaxID=3075535 RepID=A0ABU2R2K1_9ACTN|nr:MULTISPECIES: carbohydrate ABC transporter permease [unclassified Streptomyces]MDT0410921.1 carbohydrate ABC transporter permease [Streptomyces sp. DSM 41979]MYQ59804.1 ABC transporter permease subunit [Streptomyces sp. SID4926]NJA54986.1 carbohydrate ABC transporter permease [Streptomyces sp. NEAU-H3]SCE11087.1 carbohydrate ABC transporter membrane protein 2, CUT1 family [Streptomyces sp. DfronAA-171]